LSATSRRKLDHILIALEDEVEGGSSTWFDEVMLIHNAISEVSPREVDTSVNFLGHELRAPIVIAGMTGGHELSLRINRVLAEAAERLGIAIGVGSQRAAIEEPKLIHTYSIVRERAPTTFVIANIGAAQVARDYDIRSILKIIDMVKADALAIHLNLLHEILQPEGQPSFKGLIAKLKDMRSEINVPLLAKETGSGISREAALKLGEVVDAIDIGGAGGTNWALIEYKRALKVENEALAQLSKLLLTWGIPTAVSICEVRDALPAIPLIATGGIRSGLDIAKALALGADLAGVALPLLKKAYREGIEGVIKMLDQMIFELKAIMALVGASTVKELKEVPIVISPRLSEWIRCRGLKRFMKYKKLYPDIVI